MKTRINIAATMTIAIAALIFGGCSMCCDTYDYDYPTFGGKHQRSNPSWGRVGSIFSDPGTLANGAGADSNLEQVEMRKPAKEEADEELPPMNGSGNRQMPETMGTQGTEEAPTPQPQPDNAANLGPWKTRPLRGEWR